MRRREPLSGLFQDRLRQRSMRGREGAILFQLPPNFKAEAATLEAFLEDAAREMATKMRLVFEFRHPSWFSDETFKVLERGMTLRSAWPKATIWRRQAITTSSFSLATAGAKSVYTDDGLRQIDDQLKESAGRGDVFAYFKHVETPEGAFYAEAVLKKLRAARMREQ